MDFLAMHAKILRVAKIVRIFWAILFCTIIFGRKEIFAFQENFKYLSKHFENIHLCLVLYIVLKNLHFYIFVKLFL